MKDASFVPALHHPDPATRRAAAQALGETNDPEAVEPLCGRLLDPDLGVRLEVVEALRKLGDRRATPALRSALRVRDQQVLVAVIRTLGAMKDADAIPDLEQLLQDPDRPVPARLAAAWALRDLEAPALTDLLAGLPPASEPPLLQGATEVRARCGDTRLAPGLLETARSTKLDPAARAAALRCLGWLRYAEAVPELLALLEDAATPSVVRSAAIRCLGLIRDPRIPDALLRALNGTDFQIRHVALLALARTGHPQLLDLLPACLLDSKEGVRIRCAAATLLGAMRDGHTQQPFPQAVAALSVVLPAASGEFLKAVVQALGALGTAEPLYPALRHPDPHARLEATRQLSALHDPVALEPLRKLLVDPEPEVRAAVLEALSEVAPEQEEYRAALRQALHDPHVAVRRSAVLLFQGEGQVDAWCAALQDENPEVCRAALSRLEAHPDSRATRPVASLLVHSVVWLRSAAVEVLGRIGTPEALAAVAVSAREPDPGVRGAAVRTLGAAGVTEPLYVALRDRSQEVRQEAAAQLALIRDPGAVRVLSELLQDPDGVTRAAAAWALGALGSPEALPVLRRRLRPLFGERNRYVLQAMRDAVAQIEARKAAALPIPGQGLPLTPEVLPRPAGEPSHPAERLPRVHPEED